MAGQGLRAEQKQRAQTRLIKLERREDKQKQARDLQTQLDLAAGRRAAAAQVGETQRTEMRQTGETSRLATREKGLGLRQQASDLSAGQRVTAAQVGETGRTEMRETGASSRLMTQEGGLGTRQQALLSGQAEATTLADERATAQFGRKLGARAYFEGADPNTARRLQNSGGFNIDFPTERYDPFRAPAKKQLIQAVREDEKEITPAMVWEPASGEYKQAVDTTYADIGDAELTKKIDDLRRKSMQGLR